MPEQKHVSAVTRTPRSEKAAPTGLHIQIAIKRPDTITITHACGHAAAHPAVGRFGVNTCVNREEGRMCLECFCQITKVFAVHELLATAPPYHFSEASLAAETGLSDADVALFVTAVINAGYVTRNPDNDFLDYRLVTGHSAMLMQSLLAKTTRLWLERGMQS